MFRVRNLDWLCAHSQGSGHFPDVELSICERSVSFLFLQPTWRAYRDSAVLLVETWLWVGYLQRIRWSRSFLQCRFWGSMRSARTTISILKSVGLIGEPSGTPLVISAQHIEFVPMHFVQPIVRNSSIWRTYSFRESVFKNTDEFVSWNSIICCFQVEDCRVFMAVILKFYSP